MEGECLCINCRNPLNILHQLGLPVHRARTDPCLMENIYQVNVYICRKIKECAVRNGKPAQDVD